MAQDLTAKKTDFISAAVTFAGALLTLTRTAEEAASYQSANAFQSGGTNAITDADCVGENAHMTAALVNGVVQIAGQVGNAINNQMRNTLRQADKKPAS